MTIWDKRIDKAEKFLEPMVTQGNKIYIRYKDERDNSSMGVKRINLFYSNVNTISASLFNSLPQPDVSRVQRGDWDDDVSRVAALICQRALTAEIQTCPSFKPSVEAAILDRLIPGQGQIWVRFEIDMDKAENGDDPSAESETGEPTPVAGTEQMYIDQVYWEDFIYEPARCWAQVTWVGRRLSMTKEEVEENWGKDATTRIQSVKNPQNSLTPKQINQDKFSVYEIWDKAEKKVYHIAKGLEEPLDVKDDPYKLRGFFPCPPPLIANPTTTAYMAIADYYFAQDQYNQLDILYARISLIIEAVKVAGCYDAANTATIGTMLQGQENMLIPVDNWAMYTESGGAKGLIDWYPVEQVATVLQLLQAQFEACKAALYEVTGMSDIMRGASNQYETAKAQEIKAGFASVRMNAYQRDVGDFVSHLLQIMAEIMVQLYSDQKLQAIVGTLDQADMQYVPQAMQLLRNDFLASAKVQVKVDSLVQADWALEKGQRTELMGVISQFLQQAVPAIQQVPEMASLLVSMLKFTIIGYKGSAEIEGILDQQLDQMVKASQQPKEPPPPTPEEQQMELEKQKMQNEMQMAQAKQQADNQKAMGEFQIKQQESFQSMQLEKAKLDGEMAMQREKHTMEMEKMQAEIAIKQQELTMKQQEMTMKLELAQVQGQMKLEASAQDHALKQETAQQSHDMSMEHSNESHMMAMAQAAEAKEDDD